ncbi:GntR family transcriptional regulator [Cellulomonas edaphi]|uniref:GntR family transcriptional regulator n=1 Tax=Cellulomonas edaphi TaxID=3053468 RepID=A0ABT7S391_9CELL|nr:GntR family transcriptional regulator [Cellulomons edaphi]MDM7830086.1 GntR family transcriptional regulator [Cellulomons edaphi]
MDVALYAKVFEALRARIESGELAVGDKLPTQGDLAAEFRVSVITVKHALALLQEAGLIARRPRIGSVVISASSTSPRPRQALPTIGCILTNFDDSFGTRVLHGLLDASIGTANVALSRTEGYHDREQQLIAQYEHLDGLILLPSSSDWIPPAILELVHQQRPLVILDRDLVGLPIATVCSDHVGAGRQAAAHLFELGHRNIGLVTSAGRVTSLDDRHTGFVYAHAARGRAFDPRHEFRDVRSTVPHSQASMDDDVARLKRFVKDNPDLTAFVGGEYSVSLLLRRACLELGMRVPQDVSIVSLDSPDNAYDDALQAFTHVAQDEHGLGQAALDGILAQIATPGSVVKSNLATTLVLGETTRPLT